MRAHGAAVRAYRSEGAHEIGLVVNIEPKYPASDSAEDMAATARAHAYMNRQYLDPALKGFYPEELAEIFGEAWPAWPAEDLKDICQPVDFIGIKYYTRNIVKADPYQWPVGASRSEEHTSELQSLMRSAYPAYCLDKTVTIHTQQQ